MARFLKMSNLEFLIASRGHVRTQVTKLHDKIVSTREQLPLIEISTMLTKVDCLDAELMRFNSDVAALLFEIHGNTEIFTKELDNAEKYFDKINECKTLLSTEKSLLVEARTTPTRVTADSIKPNKLKLPELPLPKYSHGKGETLIAFLTAFESVVKAYSLSSYEKFIFLKRQLLGPPLVLVESLELSQQSYESAVELLKKAFASDISQKFDVVGRLSNLKCNNKPYEFIGELRLIKDLFATLKIDVQTIMQYFVWQGLTADLQSQLINICNNNKPSLIDIEDNFFKALDRLNELNLKQKTRKSEPRDGRGESEDISSYAAKVEVGRDHKKFVGFCSLCSERSGPKVTSHMTRDCPRFPSAREKCVRLDNIQACTKCGFVNHCTSKCEFNFRQPCFKCSGLHMGFLCTFEPSGSSQSQSSGSAQSQSNTTNKDTVKYKNQQPRKPFSKPKSETNVVNASAAWAESVLQSHVGGEAILPTFTCRIGTQSVRGMKDCGSQSSFIQQNLVNELSLPVLSENLSITIHGFNESKKYSTMEVEVPLTFKNSVHKIRAIVIPEIRTQLNVRGLGKIVAGFRAKNYVLADSDLSAFSDEINNIRFVLGTNEAHVLKERQIMFGEPVPSVFSVTDQGVLLFGNSKRLLTNLHLLSEFKIEQPSVRSVLQMACSISPVKNQSDLDDDEIISRKDTDESCANSVVLGSDINDGDLEKATAQILNSISDEILGRETQIYNEDSTEINDKLINIVLDETKRARDGRLVVPLAWRANVSSALATNAGLAERILRSNERKLLKNKLHLSLMDEVFREQERLGIIERITDKSFFEQHPNHSFLAHMGVFKLDRETSKCRVVFLSNLSQKNNHSVSLSHNQVMHAGPSLNNKITTALLHLRFGEKLLCYDLAKAFLQLSLNEHDSNRLLFLWYRNVARNDFSLVTYRQLRLPFGLRCSPFLLMMSLYKILCLDVECDDARLKSLKALMFSLMYVDNGAISGTTEDVTYAYTKLQSVFSPYKFEVQQLTTNDIDLQNTIDTDYEVDTSNDVKLLGLCWDRISDKLSTKPLNLDPTATTKRRILSSIAQQYDVFGFHAPLLVRARLFMHALQCNKLLSWDDELALESLSEWKKIAKQANAAPVIQIDRCMGNRSGRYAIVGFTDASKTIFSAVLYLHDLDSGRLSFVSAKNRLVNTQLKTKTIPSLELQAVVLGVECIYDLKTELSGSKCMHPINILSCKLYTDSLINLHWLNSYNHKLDKMQKRSVFVLNRLEHIARLCDRVPITFCFTSTNENPADCLTRPCSYKQLLKTSYISGILTPCDKSCSTADFVVTVPDPRLAASDDVQMTAAVLGNECPFVPVNRYSSFKKLVRVTYCAMKFIHAFKLKYLKSDSKLSELRTLKDVDLYSRAYKHVLKLDQREHFPEIFRFLLNERKKFADIPPLIDKLNVFLDGDGLLKVRSKFGRKSLRSQKFPILLDKNSALTSLIISTTHRDMAHSGCYSLLSELRKEFWIPHPFSTVKRVLKDCVSCKRFNSRTVKLNQHSYRDFRSNPPSEPYKSVFIDYLGPYLTKVNDKRQKVWLLIITCLWSRSVNLKVCSDLTVKTFLQSFQMHVFDYGVPSLVLSDLGSQIVAGTNIITTHLSSVESKIYLAENGISEVKFEQYYKGNSALGSLVEICVKLTKRLIYGAIKKNVLPRDDFAFIVAQTVSLLNKRPIAFKETLRDEDLNIPDPITPELLVHGRMLLTPNLIPALEADSSEIWKPTNDPNKLALAMSGIRKARLGLIETYHKEFLHNLLSQATNVKGRYKPVAHCGLREGDIVVLKEVHLKSADFPLARVVTTIENEIGEVTNITAIKGKTGETVRRHTSSVIPLMSPSEPLINSSAFDASQQNATPARTPRAAKTRSIALTKTMLQT